MPSGPDRSSTFGTMPPQSVPPPSWLPPVPGPEAPGSTLILAAATKPAPAGTPTPTERSGMWPRIAAYLFDAGLSALLAFSILRLLDPSADRRRALSILLIYGAWAAFRVLSPALTGESPGKRMLRIETVDLSGEPITHRTRAMRELVVWLLYWIPFVAVIDAAVAERRGRRGLRDHLTGTTVTSKAAVGGGRVGAVLILGLLLTFCAGLTSGNVHVRADSTRASVAAAPVSPTASGAPLPSARSRPALRAEVIAGCIRTGVSKSQCCCIVDGAARQVPLEQLRAANQAISNRRSVDPIVAAVIGQALNACEAAAATPPSSA